MKTLSTDDLRLMIDNNQDFLLVNVLPAKDFRQQHLPDSINVPLGESDFVEQVQSAAESKAARVVVYCASEDCDASHKAAQQLEAAGFTQVEVYPGGVKAWEESGLALKAGA